MRIIHVCLFSFLIGASLHAEQFEPRYWRNVDGVRFEGVFVKELFDVYYIKNLAGKEIKIHADKLDPVDIDYLKVAVPPRVEVNLLKSGLIKARHIDVPANDVIEIVTGTVTVDKISKVPYSGTLTAEVFLIGREVNRVVNRDPVYRLIGKKTERFTFGEEKNAKHKFSLTADVRKYYRIDGAPWGAEYDGYVVLVKDAKGNVLAFESKLPDLKKENVADLRKVPVNSFFDGTGKRVPAPRPESSVDNANWTARF